MAIRSFLQPHNTHMKFINIFTFSFPILLISIFLTWAASSTSLPTPLPLPLPLPLPSSSAITASNFLSPRGYSLFASALLSPSFNATGTVLAPPDFALVLAGKTYPHAPPRASLSLLLYHTLNVPLSYQHLSTIADNSELRTLSADNCLFLYKKSNGDISISVNKKRTLSVKIRQPDLYVDDHLTVHGIDGVLDPNSASTCSQVNNNPTVRVKSHVDRIFLDHSIRALKRRGFTVVGTAMAIKRRQLMEFSGVTVFAVSDASFFSVSDGFRYDFNHHVVKKRMRLSEISRVPVGTVMETMSPNKTIVFGEDEGRLTVNGVKINVTEVYHNRWIVVISVLQSLDDVVGSLDAIGDQAPSPAPETSFTGGSPAYSPSPSEFQSLESAGVPSISQVHSLDSVPTTSPVFSPETVPSPAPIYSTDAETSTGDISPISGNPVDNNAARELSQSPSPIASEVNVSGDSAPANSPSTDESASAPGSPLPVSSPEESTVPDERCLSEVSDGGDSAVFLAVEGEDLFCPISVRRKLDESNSADVAHSVPSDLVSSAKENQSEPLITLAVPSESKGDDEEKKESKKEDQFMADDLFFYT